MIRHTIYKDMLRLAVAACCLLTAVYAFDPSAYRASRNDAIRNGVMLSYGGRSGTRLAAVTMPLQHNTCTNVYDFAVVPAGPPMRETGRDDYCTWYLPEDGLLSAAPGETLVLPFTVTDASRLDSAVLRSGDDGRIRRISNRVVLAVRSALTEREGVETAMLRDLNANGRIDAADRPLTADEPVELLPGDTLQVLVAVVIPAGIQGALEDTVSLSCATQRLSPSGRRLTRVYGNVIRVEDTGNLFTVLTGNRLYKNESIIH